MTILVTGATGLVAPAVADQPRRRGHDILGLEPANAARLIHDFCIAPVTPKEQTRNHGSPRHVEAVLIQHSRKAL